MDLAIDGGRLETYILISLMPRHYQTMIIEQTKKYEYRRGNFVQQPVIAFVYSTLSESREDIGYPRGEIGGVVKLGTPVVGVEEVIDIRTNQGGDTSSVEVMRKWLEGFSTASAHSVEEVYRFAEPIFLPEIRRTFPNFYPPQRYIVLNRNLPLLDFLKKRGGTF